MTDITTPESARLTLEREIEIGTLATKLRIVQPYSWNDKHTAAASDFERGARAGLSAYRECYELAVLIVGPDFAAERHDELRAFAEAALEAAR